MVSLEEGSHGMSESWLWSEETEEDHKEWAWAETWLTF
jgi:hypothetical protein